MADDKILDLGKLEGPVLIFGGPNSNLAATQAMQLKAAELGIMPENIICTGDLVGLCAEPDQTISLIKDWGIHVVQGATEKALSEDAESVEGNADQLAGDWYGFARDWVRRGNAEWLGTLPRQIRFQAGKRSFCVVNAGVESLTQNIFPSTPLNVKAEQLALTGCDLVFAGRSGIPFGQKIEGGAWINAGMVGMPANDGTDDGWYFLMEPAKEEGKMKAQWHRLEYDASQAQGGMVDKGLSEGYAEALVTGLWPNQDRLPPDESSDTGIMLRFPPVML